jgi:hypothetical protein
MTVTILGMSLWTFVGRLIGAIVTGAVSIFLFLIIPQFAYSNLPSGILGANESQIILYGVAIAILGGIQVVFKDRWLGDGATIANGVLQIYYIYIVTSGGIMTFALQNGTSITLNFQTILYFLMLPSAISIVIGMFRALSRPSVQRFEDAEEIILR